MAFFPPIPLIRKNHIVKQFHSCGAVSEETAKTLAEAGGINPNGFRRITNILVRAVKTADRVAREMMGL